MERLSSRQLILIGSMYMLDSSLISTTSQTVYFGKQHAPLSYILPTLIILGSFYLLTVTMNRFGTLDLFSILTTHSPQALIGKGIASIYVLFYFFILSRDLRMLLDFTHVALLPNTPLVILGAFLTITIIYKSRLGIEVLGRMTELFGVVFIFLVILLPLLLLKDFDLTAFEPVFYVDVPGVLIGSWHTFSYMGELLALPFLAAGVKLNFRHGLYASYFGCGLIILLTLLNIMTLGVELTPKLFYPNYELVRQIRVTDFIDRFELPIIGIWMPVMITKIAYSLYFVTHGIKKIFPSPPRTLLTGPIGLLAFVCSMWFFESAVQLFNFNREWTIIAIFPQVILPVLLFFWLKPKNKKKQSGKENKSAI